MEKLLPRGAGGNVTASGEGSRLEWVLKDGQTFLAPVDDKAGKINGFRRWEQAFRMYATIYCGANPHRAKEIWQYISVINTAASSYIWENVYNYDVVFCHLMAFNPQRNWSTMYNQMWNLSMKDPLPKNHNNRGSFPHSFSQASNATGPSVANSSSTTQSKKGKKNIHCWNFNKGIKCKYGNQCRFIERCSYCDSPSHPIIQCPKIDKKERERIEKSGKLSDFGGIN